MMTNNKLKNKIIGTKYVEEAKGKFVDIVKKLMLNYGWEFYPSLGLYADPLWEVGIERRSYFSKLIYTKSESEWISSSVENLKLDNWKNCCIIYEDSLIPAEPLIVFTRLQNGRFAGSYLSSIELLIDPRANHPSFAFFPFYNEESVPLKVFIESQNVKNLVHFDRVYDIKEKINLSISEYLEEDF